MTLPRRVLIVGNPRTDTVGDSYRRALEGFYEVKVVNPFEVVTLTPPSWTGLNSVTFQNLFQGASRAVLRDPLALVYPKLLRAAREFAPDVVLVTAIESLAPKVVAGLRGGNSQAKIFGVFSDHIANFARGYFFHADYDALFFKDHFIVDRLRAKLGFKHVHYLPQACDPTLHRKVELTDDDRAKLECDIAIAGNLHYFRAVQMAPLATRDLRIYGAAPAQWLEHPITRCFAGFEVRGELKCKAMRAARIVLNNNHYAEIAGTNKRTFEVAAMGAFQLTDTPALADVFVPDEEVARFDTRTDMVEKVDFFLKRPDERAKMAERAHARAHREHTYAHRWVAHMLALGLAVPREFPVQPERLAIRAQ